MQRPLISLRKLISILSGPLVFSLVVVFLKLSPENPLISYTLACALWMAIWWISEAVPLAVTSLLPVVLFPLMGIMNGKDVSATYFNHVIFLFIGGFIVALAMQKWNLHKRIALKILMYTGIGPGRILFGFMGATAFLSMWISNTATTMMMVPILISIIAKLEESIDRKDVRKYSVGLLLGVAYSASIGGVATLVGTPPNLSFARIFQIMFPAAPEISFAQWFFFAIPLTLLLLIIVWIYLYFIFKPKDDQWKDADGKAFRSEYKALGPISQEEKIILVDFCLLATLWLTRADIEIGNFVIPGWADLFPASDYINDGTVAIMLSIPLFFIPARSERGGFLMDWQSAGRLPWNIVLLFGGGFALASGFKESGLSVWFGEQMSWIAGIHPLFIIFMIAIMMTFLTELTSNTATTEMLLPILAGLSVSTEINPLLLMIPATLSGSMAFMLPVATPPNAIVFGTERLRIAQMARTGLLLNIIGAILITLFTYYYGTYIFDINLQAIPDWAVIR